MEKYFRYTWWYNYLSEAGKWRNTSVTHGADSKERKDDPKFIALVAAVKELSKQLMKPST
jgi:hypothetical protein